MGKRGGARVIYILRNEEYPVFLIGVFAKNEKSNLTKKNYRAKRRSCNLCKPNKTYREDARDFRTVRESIGHDQQMGNERH